MNYLLIFFKKIIKFVFNFFIYFLCFNFYLFIKILSPFVIFRFGYLRNDVIGNSFFDLEFYLSYKKKFKVEKTYIDLFYPIINIYPNSFFKELAIRNINISFIYRYMYSLINFIGDKKHITKMIKYVNGSRDVDGLFESTKPNLSFLNTENITAINFLQKNNIYNKKFVCVIIRDNAYKNNYQSHIKTQWDYHSYRNTNVENFEESILYLINQGYFVLRMGKIADNKIQINNKNFFDYPFSKDKSDFLDIWLMANCFFCITTGTGLDDVCVSFRKPIVEVSYLPMGHIRCNQAFTVSIFKKLQNKKTKKFLSIKDQISYNLIDALHKNIYDNENIEIIDNTSKEILEAVTEMDLKLNNRWFEDDKDIKNQEIFFDHIKKWKEFNNKIGKLNSQSRVGRNFLRSNISWLIN